MYHRPNQGFGHFLSFPTQDKDSADPAIQKGLRAAALLLAIMALLSGGAARRESVTVDEVAHIGAGLSYLQKL